MKKGEVVIVSLAGDSGKPRPAVVLVSDDLADIDTRLLVLPTTTVLMDWPTVRVNLVPSSENGLRKPSQVMIDRATTLTRDRVGARIGKLSEQDLARTVQLFLGFLGLP